MYILKQVKHNMLLIDFGCNKKGSIQFVLTMIIVKIFILILNHGLLQTLNSCYYVVKRLWRHLK